MFAAMDGTKVGTIVAKAEACDPDGPGNNDMFYYRFNGTALCKTNHRDFCFFVF